MKSSRNVRSFVQIFFKRKAFLKTLLPSLQAFAAACACSERSGDWRERQCHLHHFQWLHELKKDKAENGRGGDKHQKERKQVQGDAATDLVRFGDSCLAMRFFFSPLSLLHGLSSSTLLCPTQGLVHFFFSRFCHALLCLYLP
jgi:hypothetical protein